MPTKKGVGLAAARTANEAQKGTISKYDPFTAPTEHNQPARNGAAPMAFDFFGATAPSTSIIGLNVISPRPCGSCGSQLASIGSSRGPHAASLTCLECSRHVGWLSGETHRFITEIIDHVGRPTEPITVRSASTQ
jgi:hypothetical protein